MDSKNQPPPPPPPPKSFNEVTIESLEFVVDQISIHRTAIAQLRVAVEEIRELMVGLRNDVDLALLEYDNEDKNDG